MNLLILSNIVAVPIPALDLDKITTDSDLIVIGRVVSIQKGQMTQVEVNSQKVNCRITDGVIHIESVLKGTVPSNDVKFRMCVPEEFVGWRLPSIQTHGAFFFKTSPTGDLEFTSPYNAFLVALATGVPPGSSAIDAVVAAIGAVLSAPTSTATEKLAAVQSLTRSNSDSSLTALQSALNSSDAAVRLTAASGLLVRNNISGLPPVRDALSHELDALPPGILTNATYGLAEGLRTPKAVPYLVELLHSPSPAVRRAAVSGLMHSQSQDAIAPLLSMVEDPDEKVRYYSVVGLAEITGQMEWRPNPDDFAASGTKYLKHWTEWGQGR